MPSPTTIRLLWIVALIMAINTVFAQDRQKQFPQGLTMGVASTENLADTAARWGPLEAYMSKQLGVPFKMRYATDYAGIVEAMRVGQAQVAHLAAATYALLYEVTRGEVEPLLAEINADGADGYQAIVVVRKDSPIQTIEQLKGKSLAFVDPNSTSGYMVPFYHFSQAGYMKPGFFARTGFSGSHENGILAVINGTYNAATTFIYSEKSSPWLRMEEKGMIKPEQLRVIWRSSKIANGPLTVRKDLPGDLKRDINAAFLSMPRDVLKSISGGFWKDWRPVEHKEYEEFIKILEFNRAARRS